RGLDLAAARGAGDERRHQAASAERVGLDEVLLGGHRSCSGPYPRIAEKRPTARTSNGSRARRETLSATSPSRPRRTEAVMGTRISWATRASAPTRVGSIARGSAVMSVTL